MKSTRISLYLFKLIIYSYSSLLIIGITAMQMMELWIGGVRAIGPGSARIWEMIKSGINRILE